jgi:hypothetical protein
MASRSSLPKSPNTQSNALSGHVPSVRQLCLWDLLAKATRVPLNAELSMLLDDLDEAITDLPIEQQIFVAGEGLAKLGEIVGLRAESHLQAIHYLLHPNKEPVVPLDAFDRYVRQSMAVDLDQFCAALPLPELERGYQKTPALTEEDVAQAKSEILAAIHSSEPDSPLDLAHDEDVGRWTTVIADLLKREGGMDFWAIVHSSGLAPVEVLLGLLLGNFELSPQTSFYGSLLCHLSCQGTFQPPCLLPP